MMLPFESVTVSQMRRDLIESIQESSMRKITHISKWSSELLMSIELKSQGLELSPSNDKSPESKLSSSERSRLWLTQTCMECQEFDRVSFICADSTNPVLRFMHFYGKYLAGEKTALDKLADSTDKSAGSSNLNLASLLSQLETVFQAKTMDSFLLYLYGQILHDSGNRTAAMSVLLESIVLNSKFFGSWRLLATLVESVEELKSLVATRPLPDHWLKNFFLGELYIQLQFPSDALSIYSDMNEGPLPNCPFVLTQMALAQQSLQNLDEVVELFKAAQIVDPYRIENVDAYSNALFVKGMRVELANLAHNLYDVNRYCPETCCVVGNYYSLRGEHEKAVTFFQRALKLDKRHGSAWTLMGHEFLELKNTSGAIVAYRNAIEVDPKDYKAYYGLGQLYEILKMHHYAIYYYDVAHKLRPQDSRMIIALGDMLEKQNKLDEARRCYWKAHCVGDIEGLALVKLGKLFEKLKDNDQAAEVYMKYLARLDEDQVTDPATQPGCLLFLANHFLNRNSMDEAYNYAQSCLEFDAQREEAKRILKLIASVRSDKSPTADGAEANGSIVITDMSVIEGSPMNEATPQNGE